MLSPFCYQRGFNYALDYYSRSGNMYISPYERSNTMVHIRGHLTEREWNWLKAKLNNEFIDSEIADSIKAKIKTNTEDEREVKIQQGRV